MAARLVLNLRGSRREDLMPTGGSTSDEQGYEMKTSSPGRSFGDRGVIFVSRERQDSRSGPLSPRTLVHLNQIKPSNDYCRSSRRPKHIV